MYKPFSTCSVALYLALFGLAACQPTADPAMQSDGASADSSVENALVEAVNRTEAEIAAVSASTTDDHTHNGDHDPHADDDNKDDGHEHNAHDQQVHDHDDHDDVAHEHHEYDHDGDDHEEHDHAGGEAHLHGHAELAVARDGDAVSVSLISPLANFGLSESNPDIGDTHAYGDAVITLIGGDCSETGRAIEVETNGQHGQMQVDLTFTCASISGLTGATTPLFSQYPGFEEIDAVVLTETDQAAMVLTPTQNQLAFP